MPVTFSARPRPSRPVARDARNARPPVQGVEAAANSKARKQGLLQGCVNRPSENAESRSWHFAGTRQAFLPGGLRTGAPGEYFGKGKAMYRLRDEDVRYFVAPPVQDILNSPVRIPLHAHSVLLMICLLKLKPYVQAGTYLSEEEMGAQPFGKIPKGGLTAEHYALHANRDAQ